MSLSLSLRTVQYSFCGHYAYQIITKFLPFVFLCLTAVTSHAQSVVVSDSDKTYFLFKNSVVLEVERGQVTIDSLLQHPENYRFVSLKQKPVRPNSKQAYWFKVDLTNPTPENYFLRFFYVGDMPVRVYEVHKDRIIGSGQVDFFGAATKDLFQRGRSIVPLRLRQGQTNTLFFYVEKMGIPTLHVGAMSSHMLAKDTHYQDLFYGLAYGFLLIIAAYSLLLGIRLEDRDNVFYSITAIIGGLYYDIAVGNILELTGDWVITLKDNYGVLAGIVTFISILFTLSFLQVKQFSRWLYRLGILLLWANAIGAGGVFCVYVLGQNSHQLQFEFANLAIFSGTIFSLMAGIVISLKRYKPAYFVYLWEVIRPYIPFFIFNEFSF